MRTYFVDAQLFPNHRVTFRTNDEHCIESFHFVVKLWFTFRSVQIE